MCKEPEPCKEDWTASDISDECGCITRECLAPKQCVYCGEAHEPGISVAWPSNRNAVLMLTANGRSGFNSNFCYAVMFLEKVLEVTLFCFTVLVSRL